LLPKLFGICPAANGNTCPSPNGKRRRKNQIYIAICESYAASQPDSAVHYAIAGIRLAEKRNDRQGQASLLLTLGHANALHHHPVLSCYSLS